MRSIFLIITMALSFSAHAGLFDQLSDQDDARHEAIAAQNDASRHAYVESVTVAWLLKNLGMPAGTSVVNEGETHKGIGYGTQYNVGGVWGCEVFAPNGMGLGVACINSSGQRHNFTRGPINRAADQWYCINYPQDNPQCHHSKRRK